MSPCPGTQHLHFVCVFMLRENLPPTKSGGICGLQNSLLNIDTNHIIVYYYGAHVRAQNVEPQKTYHQYKAYIVQTETNIQFAVFGTK